MRWCIQWTGNIDVAEDLTQEVLLEAWRHASKLRNHHAYEAWLRGIARNICLRWSHRQCRELTQLELPSDDEQLASSGQASTLADDFDLEIELERSELAELLDRALALLPADTRTVLIQKYVEDFPHAEIAARLRMSEGAVAMRLQRGKLALRRVLATELLHEATAYDLVAPEADFWQETRIWCPRCGQHRVHGNYNPASGQLLLRCPHCHDQPGGFDCNIIEDPALFAGVKGYRTAFLRSLAAGHSAYSDALADRVRRCRCGALIPVQIGPPEYLAPARRTPYTVYQMCAHCGTTYDCTLHGLALLLPDTRRFWRAHPRMRMVPVREVEIAGSPAFVTSFESVMGHARLDVIFQGDTCQPISIHGAPATECDGDSLNKPKENGCRC